jgi:hypothetical protein
MIVSLAAVSSGQLKELGWTQRYPSWRDGFPAVYRTS